MEEKTERKARMKETKKFLSYHCKNTIKHFMVIRDVYSSSSCTGKIIHSFTPHLQHMNVVVTTR